MAQPRHNREDLLNALTLHYDRDLYTNMLIISVKRVMNLLKRAESKLNIEEMLELLDNVSSICDVDLHEIYMCAKLTLVPFE